MSALPRQKLNDYYDQFRPVDVTFTKEVIQTTGLVTKEIQLKCASDFFPCVIYSTSFEAAKVVANNKSGLLDKLKITNNMLSIRFFFKIPATEEQVVFLVPARMTGNSSYGESPDMTCFTLDFSSRPPDDFIEIMGRILEATMNFAKRREEKVQIAPEMMRKMGLVSKDATLQMGSLVRRCILREVSFGSARVIVMDSLPEDVHEAVVKIEFDDPREDCILHATLVKQDLVANTKNMYMLTLVYNEPVPMPYKVRLNNFITTIKVDAHKEHGSPEDASPITGAPITGASATDGSATDGAADAAQPVVDGLPATDAADTEASAISPEEK
ncbi:MAG: pilus assembly protein PilZ [Spirochaetaceae bacterium]|jgi:hypothetical protein|nr:pilus assembly protein PilZ [Spirochaetaceae bacterium]